MKVYEGINDLDTLDIWEEAQRLACIKEEEQEFSKDQVDLIVADFHEELEKMFIDDSVKRAMEIEEENKDFNFFGE